MNSHADRAATTFNEGVSALERQLAETRSQWDDQARHAFDGRHTDPLLAEARRASNELTELAREISTALTSLASIR